MIPVYSESKATLKKIHIEWIDGNPLMCHFQSIKGIAPSNFKPFLDNFVEDLNTISPKAARYTEIEHSSPNLTFMVKVDFGIPFIGARACPVVAYHCDEGEDFIFMVTTKGTEDLILKYKDRIGDAVIPGCELNYFRCKPWYENGTLIGTHMEQVCKVDPKGQFPDFIKTIIARYLAEPILLATAFMRKKG